MKKRIIGIDIARALAIIGMILVNFKIVLGAEGTAWLKTVAGLFDGKAAATFVVLAGVGIALMTRTAHETKDPVKWKTARSRLLKRVVFLFVVGLSYIAIWPADILHFYAIYMLITLALIKQSPRVVMGAALVFIFSYPLLMMAVDYEVGWDFSTLVYTDFWAVSGFLRNLFYNGFHPVFPWAAFMLVGLWFGRKPLHDKVFVKRAFGISLAVFGIVQLFSYGSLTLLAGNDPALMEELVPVLGTAPMPPLPLYMVSGSSIAIAVIAGCILLGQRYAKSRILHTLHKTGQLALTFYVAHVVLGMGVIDAINPDQMGQYSITFSVLYALGFSGLCILFAVIWTRTRKVGPLEWVMRKLTG